MLEGLFRRVYPCLSCRRGIRAPFCTRCAIDLAWRISRGLLCALAGMARSTSARFGGLPIHRLPPPPTPPSRAPAHSRCARHICPVARWLRRASPGPWWSTEKAFWTRSSRLLAKAEALGSIGYKSTVDVDDGSTGGSRLEAVSRPPHSRLLRDTPIVQLEAEMGSMVRLLDELRCVVHLSLTLIIPHLWPASLLAGSCLSRP